MEPEHSCVFILEYVKVNNCKGVAKAALFLLLRFSHAKNGNNQFPNPIS